MQPSPPSKRVKLTGTLPFHDELLVPANIAQLRDAYAASQPYHHAVVPSLFAPDFLLAARREIVDQISFTEKETDIYKIAQTGDLTNLSGLPAAELALLPTLLELRDSLYSKEFRTFLREVTGCGALSGVKTDMSCADYGKGSYLLNHDDVIGTRRISFILYLVLPEPKWDKDWGGALELYPVLAADSENPDRPNVPTPKPSVSIPPCFNQFAFFEVQPGHSFHSVEEVVVEGDGIKGGQGARMSISGWFHKPVEGEEGYEGVETSAPKSSLQQLYATTLQSAVVYDTELPLPLPLTTSAAETTALSALLNPAYFKSDTLAHLRNQFVETSQLVLADFLKKDVALELENLITLEEQHANKGRRREVAGRTVDGILPQDTGANGGEWEIIGPPHIQRFLSLTNPTSTSASRLSTLLASIQAMLTSTAFRTLLAALTSLLPLSHTTQTRRFRPSLDYTLARGEPIEGEAKLDLGLCLTPVHLLVQGSEELDKWESGDQGAWELWLAPDESGSDEATYGGAQKGQKAADTLEEDDEPLLALEPGWNRLHLVLRDPGVLKFVKYVSAGAPGSRWDVSGEWDVSMIEEDDE